MAPNTRGDGFSIRHVARNYTHNSITKGSIIRTFYLSNDCSTIEDIYSRSDTTFYAYLQSVNSKTIQVLCGSSTYRMTALLSEVSIVCVRAECEIRIRIAVSFR